MRMNALKFIPTLEDLGDTEIVKHRREAMIGPGSPQFNNTSCPAAIHPDCLPPALLAAYLTWVPPGNSASIQQLCGNEFPATELLHARFWRDKPSGKWVLSDQGCISVPAVTAYAFLPKTSACQERLAMEIRGMFISLVHLILHGQWQAFPGFSQPCNIAAQTFKLVPLMNFGRHAGIQREPGHLANHVDRKFILVTLSQRLKGTNSRHFRRTPCGLAGDPPRCGR